ncbi:MAG: hypothetical protein AB1726_05880 [Planctomycetota bacterium]
MLATTGACGNLNPPAENVPPAKIAEWGGTIAARVAGVLERAAPLATPRLRVRARTVSLAAEVLAGPELAAHAERLLADTASRAEWGERHRRAVASWQAGLSRAAAAWEIELFALRLGPCVLLGVNGEPFSLFTAEVRRRTGAPVSTIGYANGLTGYLAPAAAYREGGYEVDVAHVFYDTFRAREGALEALAAEAAELVQEVLD